MAGQIHPDKIDPGAHPEQGPARKLCRELMEGLEAFRRINFPFGSCDDADESINGDFSREGRDGVRGGGSDPRCSTTPLFGKTGGQMFGVLVCLNSEGMKVVLRAFSGQYNGLWTVDGWVPPVLDACEFDRLIAAGDPEIKALSRKIDLETDKKLLKKLRNERRELSRNLMIKIHDLYTLKNFLGEKAPMTDVFKLASDIGDKYRIPAGTGDCCLPKLLNAAVLAGLTPVDGAEFYWGRGNASGTRRHRSFYPPCEEKCLPILGFMTRGLEEETINRLLNSGGTSPPGGNPGKPALDILFADSHIVVINKPSGLLAVPGRGPGKQDSAEARIKNLFPGCPDQPSVHRLDMDTSGLMVFALNPHAQRDLSVQFQRRRVKKEYIAILDGSVRGNEGEIRLSFRLDPRNRPYQVWDPERGKEGVTRWKLLGKTSGAGKPDGTAGERGPVSLVLFRPATGRTHQLRLHSSHPFGLGAPIRGDRLYGRGLPGDFLKLHASSLSFFHPVTGNAMEFRVLPPFFNELSSLFGEKHEISGLFPFYLP